MAGELRDHVISVLRLRCAADEAELARLPRRYFLRRFRLRRRAARRRAQIGVLEQGQMSAAETGETQ